MELGYMPDHGHGGHASVAAWVRGEPELGWMSLKLPTTVGDIIYVSTYRCTNCGFLENYARSE